MTKQEQFLLEEAAANTFPPIFIMARLEQIQQNPYYYKNTIKEIFKICGYKNANDAAAISTAECAYRFGYYRALSDMGALFQRTAGF